MSETRWWTLPISYYAVLSVPDVRLKIRGRDREVDHRHTETCYCDLRENQSHVNRKGCRLRISTSLHIFSNIFTLTQQLTIKLTCLLILLHRTTIQTYPSSINLSGSPPTSYQVGLEVHGPQCKLVTRPRGPVPHSLFMLTFKSNRRLSVPFPKPKIGFLLPFVTLLPF